MLNTDSTTTTSQEIWKTIPGYEGLYSISNDGRVKNERWNSFLRPSINHGGYACIRLSREGCPRFWTVHALVALTFIGPRPDGKVINHLDGNKLNNRPENLEYCTGAENMRHAAEHGLMSSGEVHSRITKATTNRGEQVHLAKLTEAQVIEMRALFTTGDYTFDDLGERFGVANTAAMSAIRGATWSHLPGAIPGPGGKAKGDRNASRLHPDRLKRGQNHPRAVVTDQQVREMRAEYTGVFGQLTALAKKYSLPRTTVWGIVNRKRYGHIT